MQKITKKLIKKYDIKGPYYTSYPILSQWSHDFTGNHFKNALEEMFSEDAASPLSLYIHFPFCPKLCYYCCCNIKITKNRGEIRRFLDHLVKEVNLFADFFSKNSIRPNIREVHFGGGSPSFMTIEEMDLLITGLKSFVDFKTLSEFIIEVDARTVDENKLNYYHEKGINRISLGIQDFDPLVQKAVNREQPVEYVERLLSPNLRKYFKSVNFDLIYGLPLQTVESFKTTIATALGFLPDRICLYNYGHTPEVHKHQSLIRKSDLPDIYEKTKINLEAIQKLLDCGYERIGIDHFARPYDDLAEAMHNKAITRIFNGYACGRTRDLIGLGPTSSSSFSHYYTQNVYSHSEYYKRIDAHEFPILRGFRLNRDDIIRRDVINNICTNFSLDIHNMEKKYNIIFNNYFQKEIVSLDSFVQDGILKISDNKIIITSLGKNFLRHVCMVFDNYLQKNKI
jgi:oxygen-independent coproporphyrinogen-3 oxidase